MLFTAVAIFCLVTFLGLGDGNASGLSSLYAESASAESVISTVATYMTFVNFQRIQELVTGVFSAIWEPIVFHLPCFDSFLAVLLAAALAAKGDNLRKKHLKPKSGSFLLESKSLKSAAKNNIPIKSVRTDWRTEEFLISSRHSFCSSRLEESTRTTQSWWGYGTPHRSSLAPLLSNNVNNAVVVTPSEKEWEALGRSDTRRPSSLWLPVSAGIKFMRSSSEFVRSSAESVRKLSAVEGLIGKRTSSLPRVDSGQSLLFQPESLSQVTPAVELEPTPRAEPDWARLLGPSHTRKIQSELQEVPSTSADASAAGWEQFLEKSSDTLSYVVWKKPWKNGLNSYKSATYFRGVSADELRAFQNDDEHRPLWDESILQFSVLPSDPSVSSTQLQYWRMKFPRPLAQREYVFARKDWYCEEDNATYSLCRSCDVPDSTIPGPRRVGPVRVPEYFDGHRIMDATKAGDSEPSSLMVIYVREDNGVGANMINLTLKRGLWSFVQKHEKELHKYLGTRPKGWKLPPLPASLKDSELASSQRRSLDLSDNEQSMSQRNARSTRRWRSLQVVAVSWVNAHVIKSLHKVCWQQSRDVRFLGSLRRGSSQPVRFGFQPWKGLRWERQRRGVGNIERKKTLEPRTSFRKMVGVNTTSQWHKVEAGARI